MKRKHIRIFKRLFFISILCLGLSWLLQEMLAPPAPTQTFNLEKELENLPPEQREAARSKWQTLSKTEQQQAQKTIQNLSAEEKQEAKKQLQKKLK